MRWLVVLILFLATVGYLFIGAAVFQAFESDNEQDTKTDTRQVFNDFVARTGATKQELETFVKAIITAYDNGVIATNDTDSLDNWNFASSFFFSATVVTTIGYGHISPSTRGGQIFFIAYALIGIPLAGLFFAGFGQKIYTPFRMCRSKSQSKCWRITSSVIIALMGWAILILVPAYGLHRIEEWNMREAIYFSVVTLSTVGFGDFVPGQDEKDHRTYYQIVVIAWIFLGLSWVGMILADIGDFFSSKLEKKDHEKTRLREERERELANTSKSGAYRNMLGRIIIVISQIVYSFKLEESDIRRLEMD